jgi:predicted membrane-bound dolichyl-phosphate-mannose-protein mannosyltransferase
VNAVTEAATPVVEAAESESARRRRLTGLVTRPRLALLGILVFTLLTRIAWLGRPNRSLIFDEAYYVNAARRILGWPVPSGDPYAGAPAGLDPNTEHPPLGKIAIAASMRVFGDNPWGWRIPSILAGLVVVFCVYLVVRATRSEPWPAVYAAGVASLDNLLLIHSRIATLDVLFLAPLMVGAVLTLRKQWIWAGVACGVAALVKVPASFGVLALVVLILVMPGGGRLWLRARRALLLGGVSVVVALSSLWFLDSRYTTYDDPVTHLRHIESYGVHLTRKGGPANSESSPWQWLSNEVQIPYLRVDRNEVVGGDVTTSRPEVYFRGALNPALAGTAIMALFYAAWRWVRRKDVAATWALVWAAGVFLPFVALSVFSHRVTYIFYALPLVPAYAVAVTLLLWHEGLPRVCRWGFAVAMALGFLAYFPFPGMLH